MAGRVDAYGTDGGASLAAPYQPQPKLRGPRVQGSVLQTVRPDVRPVPVPVLLRLGDTRRPRPVHRCAPGWCRVSPTSTPHGYLRLFEAARRADWDAARAELLRLRQLFRVTHVGDPRMGRYSSAIGAFKEGLVARGVIAVGTTSEPMIPLNDAERAAVRRHLADAGLI
ncbi:MAG: hypothetical protein GEV28_36575 [Actinophytocola sp.]|uniref:hypothetical protein n=1 Tax=Actinophytocola sp. TaxID=1872138 RepID=UPI00132630F3|nr:hypothetical protein [Actinophytocola sp.]MPZ85602.1 hypothetical protein [Actinophytocola sp.]